jgi:hypothetical protein
MSPPPVTRVVDVTRPVVAWTLLPSQFVNTSAVDVCVSLSDTSPVNVSVAAVATSGQVAVPSGTRATVASTWMPSIGTVCWLLEFPWRGKYDVTATAVDAAGNTRANTTQLVFDNVAPVVAVALADKSSTGAVLCARTTDTVCTEARVSASCNSSSSSVGLGTQSPCVLQYQLLLVGTTRSSELSCDPAPGSASDGGAMDAASLPWTSLFAAAVTTWMPPVSRDGEYLLLIRAVDGAGNVGGTRNVSWWRDSTAPTSPPTLSRTPDVVTLSRDAFFDVRGVDDGSPGLVFFWYRLYRNGAVVVPDSGTSTGTGTTGTGTGTGTGGLGGLGGIGGFFPDLTGGILGGGSSTQSSGGGSGYAPMPVQPSTPTAVVQLRLLSLAVDTSHAVEILAVDSLARNSTRSTLFSWRIVSSAPGVAVLSQPATVSSTSTPLFVLSTRWANGTGSQVASFEVMLLNAGGDLGTWHPPCRFADSASQCAARCNMTRCEYRLRLSTPGPYTLQARALALNTTGDVSVISWTYKRCSDDEYADLSGDGVTCHPCPRGGDCAAASVADVVQQRHVVARAGYWASASSDGSRFYACPIPSACLGRGNGTSTRARCASGFDGVLCSSCAAGYFPQYGTCSRCPAEESSLGVFVSVLLPLFTVTVLVALYVLRGMMPRGMMKVGVSMLQIIASANSAYSIPWPKSFAGLLDVLKLFLVSTAAQALQAPCSCVWLLATVPLTHLLALCVCACTIGGHLVAHES